MTHPTEKPKKPDDEGHSPKATHPGLQGASGAIPFAGGALAAIAGTWSEHEKAKANRFYEQWLRMLQDELREKEATVLEMMARLDLNDEKIAARVESKEFQSLVKKTFRDWAGVESEGKRKLIRNILTNAAASSMTSDDVVRMFIDWIGEYSELHFTVIGAVYNSAGITRGEIWRKIGKVRVREDAAEADLYKLLIRDLSTGGVIRQHRDTDYSGNFVRKASTPRAPAGSGPKPTVSAFDEAEQYELTSLGDQFVHYAMNELAPRVAYAYSADGP